MHDDHAQSFKAQIQKATGVNIDLCYQCGKCTAGCPLNEEMDYSPNQILRMIQLDLPGTRDKILSSYGIWLCLTCETCYTRCPKEVDLPIVMDYLRSLSIAEKKVNKQAKKILSFHKTFLSQVKNGGRLFEVGLIAGYKLRTWDLMQDVDVAPKMLAKGKLNIFPHKVKGKKAIQKIFEKTLEKKGGVK